MKMDIDAWIIRRLAEPLAEALTRNTETSCYWWGAQALAMAAISNATLAVSTQDGLLGFWAITMLALAAMALRAHTNARQKSAAFVGSQHIVLRAGRVLVLLLNMWSGMLYLLRWLLVPTATTEMTDILHFVASVCFLSGMYLIACRPQPPKHDHKTTGVRMRL